MRILSQEGLAVVDLPYESVGVSVNCKDEREIVAYPSGNYSNRDGFWLMAKYSEAKKAMRAIGMLRYTYRHGRKLEMPKRLEESIDMDDDIGLYNARTCNFFYGAHVPEKYFRFPMEEELED